MNELLTRPPYTKLERALLDKTQEQADRIEELEGERNSLDAEVVELMTRAGEAEAKCDRYREALEEFAKQHLPHEMDCDPDDADYEGAYIALVTRARKALAPDDQPEEKPWNGKGIHPTHDCYISDSSFYDWKCSNCHNTDLPGSWGKLNKPCPNQPSNGDQA